MVETPHIHIESQVVWARGLNMSEFQAWMTIDCGLSHSPSFTHMTRTAGDTSNGYMVDVQS